MSVINAENGPLIQVTREIEQQFSSNQGFVKFLRAVATKLNGSNASLSEVEQRGNVPALARTLQNKEDIAEIVRAAVSPLRARIAQLEKQLNDIDASARPRS